MFLVRRNLAGDWEPAIKGKMDDRHEEYLFFVFLVQSQMAYDAALGTRINDLGDLSTQGDAGHGRLLAQNGHQS